MAAGEQTKPIELRAGPLTLWIEPDTAQVRYVRWGELEIIRGIYGAVRDRNWGTVQPLVSDFKLQRSEAHFLVTCRLVCRAAEIAFQWEAAIRGDPDGTITYGFKGEALSAFDRNRIGLCVLHPMDECAGQPCQVEHTDGGVESSRFPTDIAPWQPFKDVRAFEYSVGPDRRVEVRFEGDVFETEDQRNWTDASFKTYSTPLDQPFPIRVERGSRVTQEVRVSILSQTQPQEVWVHGGRRRPELHFDFSNLRPRVPIGAVLGEERPSPRQVQLLKALELDHLRVDLDLTKPGAEGVLEEAGTLAEAIGARLHVALTLHDEGRLEQMAAAAARVQDRIALWLVFHAAESVTSPRWVNAARERLRPVTPSAGFAAGTRAWFAELNRNRPDPGTGAFPCYSLNPQVHAFDNLSLIETLAAQPVTVQSARQFSPLPVVISWISLRPQCNPNATGPSQTSPGELPATVDPRQCSLFGAAWTLGSLARLLPNERVRSVTYYETVGWRGLMERESGSPLPAKFPSTPGGVFPLYHVLADVAGAVQVGRARSSDPLQVEGLALAGPNGLKRVLVSNFLDETVTVRIHNTMPVSRLRLLDETSEALASRDPEQFRAQKHQQFERGRSRIELGLGPHATARLDVG